MCSILREVTHHKNVPLFSGQEPQHFMLFKLKVVNHLGLRSSFTAQQSHKMFHSFKVTSIFDYVVNFVLQCRNDLTHLILFTEHKY